MKQQHSFERSARCFDSIAGFNLFASISLSRTSHNLTVFLEVHQYRAIDIPKDGQHEFSSGSLCLEFFFWPETTGASTAPIVSYSLVHNGTLRTRLLSQFDGERHLLHENDGPDPPNKSSAMHACDHRTTALGPIC